MSIGQRLWLAATLFVVVLSLYGAVLVSTRMVDYQACQQRHTKDEDCSTYEASFGFLQRLGNVLNEYSAGITALSGVAVAAFTYTLWRSTEKLWTSAESQRIADERQRRRDNSNIFSERIQTGRAVKAAIDQARASAKQAELMEQMFVGLERPYVNIENFGATVMISSKVHGYGGATSPPTIDEAYAARIYVLLSFKNFGRTPASVDEIILCSYVGEFLPDDISYNGSNKLKSTTVIQTEAIKDIDCWVEGTLAKNSIIQSPVDVFIYGFIKYRDVFDYVYIRKFAHRIISSSRIIRLPGNQHNGERRYPPEHSPEFAV